MPDLELPTSMEEYWASVTPEIREWLEATGTDGQKRVQALARRAEPRSVLGLHEACARHPRVLVRTLLAKNSKVKPSVMMMLAHDPDFRVRLLLAASTRRPEIVTALTSDTSSVVASTALLNPSLDVTTASLTGVAGVSWSVMKDTPECSAVWSVLAFQGFDLEVVESLGKDWTGSTGSLLEAANLVTR